MFWFQFSVPRTLTCSRHVHPNFITIPHRNTDTPEQLHVLMHSIIQHILTNAHSNTYTSKYCAFTFTNLRILSNITTCIATHLAIPSAKSSLHIVYGIVVGGAPFLAMVKNPVQGLVQYSPCGIHSTNTVSHP